MSLPPPPLPALVRPANTAPEPAPTDDQLNSCCEPSFDAGINKVHRLARAFGKAKSKGSRDDEASVRLGRELWTCMNTMRLTYKYTLRELADECDVNYSVLLAIHTGKAEPSISILNRLFSFMGIDILHDLIEI